MKILVIGSGAREHALAWKISLSSKVKEVFVAPGNVGTLNEPKIKNINISSHQDLIHYCLKEKIDFTVVGPEEPLSKGIVDKFEKAGLKIFGPTQYAAQLESSKSFAKEFMFQHAIPTADYQVFHDMGSAKAYIAKKSVPIVIKTDGLASGKGVVVAQTKDEAYQAIEEMMSNYNNYIVIEDFLAGEEASFIVMCDGKNVIPMATSQDHKRLLDKDLGPNTGGMGAYSPAPVITPNIHEKIMQKIIYPVIEGMNQSGHPFKGFLYAGLMIDDDGNPFVIEFNCRFGDPEAEPVLFRLESDLVDLLEAALANELNKIEAVKWSNDFAIAVVLAARGYPKNPLKGDVISGIEKIANQCKVFYAGTALNENGRLIVNGGRVLCVVGSGKSIQEAREITYKNIEYIQFDGMQYRKDIGYRALNK